MRSVLLASALTAGVMWLAFGGTPAESQTGGKAVSCQTCGQGADCPHCAAGKNCPCHGKWGSHKWEYKCVRPAKKPQAMTQQFSGLGDEGWRLVEADGGIWCFSRMRKTQ
ncbi:MAG: hypothetical protein JRE45_09030 [Deltaproteobacteria bacterium]|nr:hypothetical protein [Deltaproteobacteria bacterium]